MNNNQINTKYLISFFQHALLHMGVHYLLRLKAHNYHLKRLIKQFNLYCGSYRVLFDEKENKIEMFLLG